MQHQIDLENEHFQMPFTWNIHNFSHNSPRILTILHAIYLKYRQFYKRIFYDINNFVSQYTLKIHDSTSRWIKKLPEIVTISQIIQVKD